jgi:RNA polymerase sigma-70 factor (ECF subfamily)
MTYPSDEIILDYILSFDKKEQGFKWIVGKYKEKLYWHIRRMVQNHEDADDVLQNTFIKVVRHIDKFSQNSKLYTWMYRIASNEALNFLNSKKRHAIDELEPHHTNGLSVETWFDENEVLKQINIAINDLPDKQKLVFSLRYYEEMTYKQIADITETSEGALKASYHHAVKKIEEHIKKIV